MTRFIIKSIRSGQTVAAEEIRINFYVINAITMSLGGYTAFILIPRDYHRRVTNHGQPAAAALALEDSCKFVCGTFKMDGNKWGNMTKATNREEGHLNVK